MRWCATIPKIPTGSTATGSSCLLAMVACFNTHSFTLPAMTASWYKLPFTHPSTPFLTPNTPVLAAILGTLPFWKPILELMWMWEAKRLTHQVRHQENQHSWISVSSAFHWEITPFCLFCITSLTGMWCADWRLEAIQAVEESHTWSPWEFWNSWCWGHHR